jgi:hypothetical protein
MPLKQKYKNDKFSAVLMKHNAEYTNNLQFDGKKGLEAQLVVRLPSIHV